MALPKRKYRNGYIVRSISDLAIGLETGHWYYWNDKVMHPGFMLSMPLRTIINAIDKCIIKEAVDQQKEYYAKKQEEYLESLHK